MLLGDFRSLFVSWPEPNKEQPVRRVVRIIHPVAGLPVDIFVKLSTCQPLMRRLANATDFLATL